jgi:hypothetical protein
MGEINAGALIVQEGAYFDGNSKMATGGAAPSASASPAAASTSISPVRAAAAATESPTRG